MAGGGGIERERLAGTPGRWDSRQLRPCNVPQDSANTAVIAIGNYEGGMEVASQVGEGSTGACLCLAGDLHPRYDAGAGPAGRHHRLHRLQPRDAGRVWRRGREPAPREGSGRATGGNGAGATCTAQASQILTDPNCVTCSPTLPRWPEPRTSMLGGARTSRQYESVGTSA